MTIPKKLANQYKAALEAAYALADFDQIGQMDLYPIVESVTPYTGQNAIEIDDAVEMLDRYIVRVLTSIGEDC